VSFTLNASSPATRSPLLESCERAVVEGGSLISPTLSDFVVLLGDSPIFTKRSPFLHHWLIICRYPRAQ
jgi:hypothetical protein